MALRRQVPEQYAVWEDPIMGVNLFDGEEDLKPGEARLMQNCVFRSGVRMRSGNSLLTQSQVSAGDRTLGGHRYYFGGPNPEKQRLIAYGSHISKIADDGTETILWSTSAVADTYFRTWSITDKVYITNGTDTLTAYDGLAVAAVTGTNIPIPRTKVCPIVDRLLAITTDGIERSDPRVDNVWSSNSSWATFRPSQVGLFTALHPFTMKGIDTVYSGAFAFQANAYYVITGTDFGSDVTSATASTDEDSAIQLLDPLVGTSSPNSVVTVPGIGIFWFTTDLNVYWVPEGALHGKYIGDKIRSTGSTAGIEATNKSRLEEVWMEYFDRYLILGIPTAGNNYADTQFWLDLYEFTRSDQTKQPTAVWYGPMTGQTVGKVWREDQQGELQLMGGEGNELTGVYVYNMLDPSRYADAVGGVDTDITMTYQTYFKDFAAFSREKYIRSLNFELKNVSGTPTVSLEDLDNEIIADVAIEQVT